MSREVVFVLEPDVGRVTVELSRISASGVDEMVDDLGAKARSYVNCGRPLVTSRRELPVLHTNHTNHPSHNIRDADEFSIWLYRLYHNSTVDGPGRRSVVQVSGCSIRCEGCYVPETHERSNGRLIPIPDVVNEIVAERDLHDGVTILGGEPFDQPEAVAELVARLRDHGLHITIYSGYTLDKLVQCRVPSVQYTLANVDLLVDGPFIKERNVGAGEYRGSTNQRFQLMA